MLSRVARPGSASRHLGAASLMAGGIAGIAVSLVLSVQTTGASREFIVALIALVALLVGWSNASSP